MAGNFEDNKLDSPLIVHKVTDASYQETASEVSVDFTHIDNEETATLERHRYRKVKKPKKWPYVLIAIIVAAVILITTLYFSGVIKKPSSGKEKESQTGYVSSTENRYEGIITVKNTYIFFEGREIDGVSDLMNEVKYLDEGTKFVVQDEKADEILLNQEILPTLDSYGIKYEVKYVVSSGLQSKNETTDNQEETTENQANNNEVAQ